MNQFLIPANSKKSMLIFGVFRPIDLIIFCCGIGATLLLLISMPLDTVPMLVIALSPVLVTGFLIFPVANYHNTLTVITSIYRFYTTRQKYIWKGWCASYESKQSDKK